MYNNTSKVLDLIFKGEYDKKRPLASLKDLVPKNQLLTVKKNHTIICQKDPVKYFYVLLSGRVSIINHISWTNDNVIEYLEPLDILGLVEYLNNIKFYTAYVLAETECFLLRIPVEDFADCIQNNNFLCYQTLLLLGKSVELSMSHSEINCLFHPKDILGYYLFHRAQHTGCPYICPLTRKALAEELHINLRTLYRYINQMENIGYLSLQRGKIHIKQEHLDKLATRYDNLIL